jgi:hypothetical protein
MMKQNLKMMILAAGVASLLLGPLFIRPAGGQDLAASGRESKEPSCDRMSASARGQATGPATFVTTVDVSVNGQSFGGAFGARSFTSTSTATLLSQSMAPDGVITGISSHVFEMNGHSDGDGQCEAGELCFTTLDRPVLTPTNSPGIYKLDSTLAIISGNNAFANLCGKIKVTADGVIDFTANPPAVRWRAAGDLCRCSG